MHKKNIENTDKTDIENCDVKPSGQPQPAIIVQRHETFGSLTGKYFHMTPDAAMEIKTGEFLHKIGPQELLDTGLGYFMQIEALRRKPWFTEEMYCELGIFLAARNFFSASKR